MKILITGSDGVVGSELVKLLRNKYEIIEVSRKKGIDITNKGQIKPLIEESEVIIHLAAIIDPKNPLLWEVNVKGTKNILECLSNQYLIYISTCEVRNPITLYEKSKKVAEDLVKNYNNWCILRFPLLVAPNKYWKKIIKLITLNFPIIGSGKQKWQLLDWRDAADSIKFTLENKLRGVFNVCSMEILTFEEIYKIIYREIHNRDPFIIKIPVSLIKIIRTFFPYELFEDEFLIRYLKDRTYDVSKIYSYGWKPKYPIPSSLREVVKILYGPAGI